MGGRSLLLDGQLKREGKPVTEVFEALNLTDDRATLLVAYSIRVDQKILRGESRRGGFPDRRAETSEYCVMCAATPLCRIPPTDAMMATERHSYKTPELIEAARLILGVEHVAGSRRPRPHPQDRAWLLPQGIAQVAMTHVTSQCSNCGIVFIVPYKQVRSEDA